MSDPSFIKKKCISVSTEQKVLIQSLLRKKTLSRHFDKASLMILKQITLYSLIQLGLP